MFCRFLTGRPVSNTLAPTQHPANASPPQDVVYYFKPSRDVRVTASLCGSDPATAFDARLYLLAGVDAGGGLAPAACAQDVCGALPALSVRGRVGRGGRGAMRRASALPLPRGAGRPPCYTLHTDNPGAGTALVL